MDHGDRPVDDRRRIAKRIADLEKMLRALHGTKRSSKRLHKIALSRGCAAVALSRGEDAIHER